MHDEIGPTDEVWQAYYEYLLYVKTKVEEVRNNFRFDND